MGTDFVLGIAYQTLKVILLVSSPMLLAGLISGILISIFQAVTQIQEMTLTFVPKILAVFLATIIFGPWILRTLLDFTIYIFSEIPTMVR